MILFLKINYFGQKIGNKYNVEDGVVNIILFETTYLLIGLFMGLVIGLGYRNPIVLAIVSGVLVLIIRTLLKNKIKNNIDFKFLENAYQKASKQKRISYFIIHMLLLLFSLALLIYFIKIIVMLMR